MLTAEDIGAVRQVLKTIGYDELTADIWLNVPNPQLDGRKPRDCKVRDVMHTVKYMAHCSLELGG